MSGLRSINPEELGAIAALLGLAPARLSVEELNVTGNFLVAIGCIVLLMAAQTQLLQARQEPKIEDTVKNLQKQVQELQDQLARLIDRPAAE